MLLLESRACWWLIVGFPGGARRFVECDLQEVTIEELEVSRPANEARIVAAVEETRAWVDAKTGEVPALCICS